METTGTGQVEEALLEALGEGPLVVDPDVMAGYAIDRATAVRPGRPLAVVRARDTADVQADAAGGQRASASRSCRGALGTGLSGGSTAIDGCITLSTERMRSHRRSTRRPWSPSSARAPQRRGEGGGREHGPLVPARPVVVRDLLDRREPGHQRRRAVLREVRRDHRLRARHRGRAGRRSGGAPRRPHDQGRRRLRPQAAVRRVGGHARRDHRGDPAAAAAAAAGHDHRGHVRRRGRRRPGRHRASWPTCARPRSS